MYVIMVWFYTEVWGVSLYVELKEQSVEFVPNPILNDFLDRYIYIYTFSCVCLQDHKKLYAEMMIANQN